MTYPPGSGAPQFWVKRCLQVLGGGTGTATRLPKASVGQARCLLPIPQDRRTLPRGHGGWNGGGWLC